MNLCWLLGGAALLIIIGIVLLIIGARDLPISLTAEEQESVRDPTVISAMIAEKRNNSAAYKELLAGAGLCGLGFLGQGVSICLLQCRPTDVLPALLGHPSSNQDGT